MQDDLKQLLQEHGGYITRRQIDEAGFEPYALTRAMRIGQIERIQRGVYRLVDTPMVSHEDLIEVTLRIPYGIVCLVSALAFYELSTFIPKAVHLAVPQKRKPPKLNYPPLIIHYFSPNTYSYGIESHHVQGNTLRIYSVEKTLVDLLRLNEKALFAEGLKNYLAKDKPKANLSKLLEAARIGRVERRLQTYLEVMAYDITS